MSCGVKAGREQHKGSEVETDLTKQDALIQSHDLAWVIYGRLLDFHDSQVNSKRSSCFVSYSVKYKLLYCVHGSGVVMYLYARTVKHDEADGRGSLVCCLLRSL